MLNKIPKILSPEIVKNLMEMGHGDTILLADANFPANTYGKRIIRADGHGNIEILKAILELMPLDTYVAKPLKLMKTVKNDSQPKIWDEYYKIIDQSNYEEIERFSFYETSKDCHTIIQTGETALYGNIILTKGVIE
ncbi:RbsD/FucU family protein [Staphylococcus haemolyticus]|uniref:RbsD/FucU family protein n=1 Tax=Staphylococcus haemolyticus TaxID=1283 RepID=UPI00143F5F46|nr:RbsD/FucU domain-containing protein [Staphylococcus haemolyticus]MCH4458080.1 fucose isomerase [Staphylococcus haemolyticus]MCH4490743.1 fucose isomerase [Staphylococcus haemolyticus]MDU0435328.1 RbsD/FucU domain-containing protein [Staphylococcus haemolyticus]NKN66928.1 fucose isomerase [Staphylococcus haemolyticus]